MTDCGKNFGQNAPYSNRRVGFKGSMFKGSEVDPSFNYLYGINGIEKKREAINPER